jgi:hypothetical protein
MDHPNKRLTTNGEYVVTAPGGGRRDSYNRLDCRLLAHTPGPFAPSSSHQQGIPSCPVQDCPVRAGLGPRRRTERGWGPFPNQAPATPNLTAQSPHAAVPISNTRAEASRQNSAKSRGPKTVEGKARSAQNALKHGLRAESTWCCRRRTLTSSPASRRR